MKMFIGSFIITFLCLGLAFWKGGIEAFFLCVVLGVMEVSLSFDNAVVNAKVLKEMPPYWQKLFLTLGIIIAVFGMRLLLPIAIVSLASGTGYLETANMAIYDAARYAIELKDCHMQIAAFGGTFLLLVFFNFSFDHEREIHWLGPFESRLAKVGKLDHSGVVLTIILLIAWVYQLPNDKQFVALIAGILGLGIYLLLDGIKALFEDSESGENATNLAKRGLASFLYLEVLDAAFSLDGVVGAFALSRDIVLIMLGLCIGAMFVRSMTVYLVRKGTLDELCYLEHGAMWAIGSLAFLMFIGALPGFHIPEWVTGLSGALLIGMSIISSLRVKSKSSKKLLNEAD